MKSGFQVVYRGTQAEIDAAAAAGDLTAGASVQILDGSGVPTGSVQTVGAGGEPAVVATSADGTVYVTGAGTVQITRALHAGKHLHVESGVTAIQFTASNWPGDGQFSIINHTGADLPVTLSGTWTGAYENVPAGASVTSGTVITLADRQRADGDVSVVADVPSLNLAPVGAGKGSFLNWAANTEVRQYEVRRATAAVGTVLVGDLIRSASTRTTGATLDAGELANWSEVSDDAVQSVAGKTGAVTLAPADVVFSATDKLLGRATASGGAGEEIACTSFARSLLDDADAGTALGTLGAAPLASPTFTGVPAAPTAAADTNTTQVATTAFVAGQASSTNPVMNGVVAVGTSLKYARADHVHPTDTSLAPLASPALTGTPTAPTAAANTNTTQIATTAFVLGQAAAGAPIINGVAAAGSATTFARADHVHPTDTSRAPLNEPTFTGRPAAPTADPLTCTTQLATTEFVCNSNPVIRDWAAVASVASGELRKATAAVGDFVLGEVIQSTSARTTGAAFDLTEAGNWSAVSTRRREHPYGCTTGKADQTIGAAADVTWTGSAGTLAFDNTSFTLLANRTYRLDAMLELKDWTGATAAERWAEFNIVKTSDNTAVGAGTAAHPIAPTYNGDDRGSDSHSIRIFTPSVDTQIKVRVTSIGGGNVTVSANSVFMCIEI